LQDNDTGKAPVLKMSLQEKIYRNGVPNPEDLLKVTRTMVS